MSTTELSGGGSSDDSPSTGSAEGADIEYPECAEAGASIDPLFIYHKGMPGEPHASEGYDQPCEVVELGGTESLFLQFECFEDIGPGYFWYPAFEITNRWHNLRLPQVGETAYVSSSTLRDIEQHILLHRGHMLFPDVPGLSFDWVQGICPFEEVVLQTPTGAQVINAERIALDVTHAGVVTRLFAGDSMTTTLESPADIVLLGVESAYCREPPEDLAGRDECYNPSAAYHIARLE